jgi:hypothetical protein
MKVVHLITTIERGGAENQLLILCQEQIKIGNQLTVLYLKGRPEGRREFTANTDLHLQERPLQNQTRCSSCTSSKI